ncbi:MAG: hypothetical protein MJZ99_04195 [Bacteroidales bacterium]|nr:hypothetical protein [Bacteroidales bacterium]
MAVVTLSYDVNNTSIQKLLEVIVSLGGKVESSDEMSSIERSLQDIANGNVFEAKDARDLFEQCGIHV